MVIIVLFPASLTLQKSTRIKSSDFPTSCVLCIESYTSPKHRVYGLIQNKQKLYGVIEEGAGNTALW